ncbi:MAG: NAD(P)H-hydrate dehydratase [Bacteroidaceae bacterium]|nr:NAD(P)H-hydrate dehydratase [Bacteroidaceae bacterium]
MKRSHVHTTPLPCGGVGGGSNTFIPFLQSILRPRPAEGHKGTFGHALLVAGSYGMAGAGILAGRSCMRSGVGKLTVHIPQRNNDIMQTALPEAILHHDEDDMRWTSMPVDTAPGTAYNAVGIGPGIGTRQETSDALHRFLESMAGCHVPMVLDADALNILSLHPDWLALLPQGTIITPHPLEYRRLVEAGACMDNVILVLKGHPTTITIPGDTPAQYVCPYGNDGMGTAGSGDVLTGIILGLLAQGYPSRDAAILGVSLHAISGDIASEALGRHSLIASDLTDYLPQAFKLITKDTLQL